MALTIGSPGLALYSIPVVWFTAFYPSFVKYLIMATTIGYNNVQPRENTIRLKETQQFDQATRDRLLRMVGAHQNGMENLPLWIGAVFAGYLTGIPHDVMNAFSIAHIALRLLFNTLYIHQTTVAVSDTRSIVWFAATGLPLALLIKSANKFASS